MSQAKVYAFLIANTSSTYATIAQMTDPQIGEILEQFRKKD